jgi:Na+/proline symporter
MTALLLTVLAFFLAHAVYTAALNVRAQRRAEDYLDGGGDIPGWAFMFAGTGVVLAALGLFDHHLLLARFGLQYNHVTVGIVLAVLAGVLVQKRLWLAGRITGLRTLGELCGAYYGSHGLRTLLVLLLLLFTVPFAAQSLGRLGLLLETASDGALARASAIWGMAFFLFLAGVIGGWRATVHVLAAQSLLVLALIAMTGATGVVALDALAMLASDVPAQDGVPGDRIPGVLQASAGLGKEATAGGFWTTTAILSAGLALVGIVLSPGFAFLGMTTRTRSGFAFQQVWMSAGLGAGILLLGGPLIGAAVALAGPEAAAAGRPTYAGLAAALADFDVLLAVGFVLLLAAALQIAVSFFVQSGASVFVIELLGRYILPGLDAGGRQLAARVTVGVVYGLIALLAAYAPVFTEVLGSLALPLAAQLLPALVGLCWVRWISRSAVLAGLVFGIVLVLFTEPAGLILFEGLFVELPWGRWPWTIHSAAWGLAFNVAAVLLVAIFTRGGEERAHRDRLHDVFARHHRQDLGGPAARGAKWSLVLVWAFLAVGPGAIMGNWFFSEPVFSAGAARLAVPSLWVWQVLFWFLGVFLVWWLAYQARMSVIDGDAGHRIALEPEPDPFAPRTPHWMDLFLERFARR